MSIGFGVFGFMKKIFVVGGSIVGAAACAAIIFGLISTNSVDITDSSKWRYVTHDEFSVRLPEALEPSTKLYNTSWGSEQIACYSCDDIVFSVAKQPYSGNSNLESVDLKKYIDNIKIDGEKLEPIAVNNGYYYKTKRNSSPAPEDSDNIFQIEALFKGDDAIYSVATNCKMEDKAEYEESMVKWVEGFSLK